MTVQISTLRVVPELDASKYAAGAAQKQAADRAMAETSRQVEGAAVAAERAIATTTMRIGAASDGFERFKRQNVTGYAASMDFEGGLRKVASGLEKGRLSAEEAANAVENLSRKYQRTADPLSALAQGNASLATAIRSANVSMAEQSNAVDALMLSYQRMAQEARAAQAAEREQQRFNSTLGVGRPAVGSASSSASVFESELARVEQMAKLHAEQAGGNFSADLNQRLGVNGFGTSARSSASVFEESARETELYARKAEQLRAILDPVGAMQARLNAELAEYATLAARGAITADELAQAQVLAQPGRQGGASANYAAINATYQLQDIVTTAAGGMSPALIGLQQGSQLAGSFSGMGIKQVGATLAGAIGGLLSPVSLIAVGLTAATAAAIQFGSQALKPVRSMDDAVKAHADSVDLLRKRYGDLGEQVKTSSSLMASGFSDASLRANEQIVRAVSRQEEKRYVSTLQSSAGVAGYLPFSGLNVKPSALTGLAGGLSEFQGPVDDFLNAIRRGTPDLQLFQGEVDKTFSQLLGSSESPEALSRSADAVKLLGESFLTAAGSIKVLGDDGKETTQSLAPFSGAIAQLKLGLADKSSDAFGRFMQSVTDIGQKKGIQNVADQVLVLGKGLLELNQQTRELDARKLAIFNTVGPTGIALSQGRINQDDSGNAALFESRERVSAERSRQAFDAQVAGLSARSPAEREAAARLSEQSRYDFSETPDARRQRIDQSGTMARLQAEQQLREAQEQRARGLSRSLADQRMEISLVGQTSVEAEALRREYQMIADLKDNASQQRTIVNPAEIEGIVRASAEMRKLNEELARAKLNDSLRTERSDMLLSGVDQQVSGRLRGAGLPVDLQSQEADYIRRTARMQETKSAITGFFTDFRQELISNGGKVGKALGETLLNSVANVFSKASDAAFERLANLAVNALFGGAGATGGGSAVGAGTDILGRLAKSGGISNDNLAPVIPVTRAGLPDVSATSDVASYIAKAAAQRGIDPDTALRVAQSEGGLSSWNLQSNYMKNGVREPSFGPYQLYTGGGLGNEFMSKTGLDPRLSSSGPAGVDFALDHASKNGWGSWYGAAKVGVGKWDGIGGGTNGAADAVNQLAASAKAAQKGLDGFGGGIGKIGQALSTSYFPPAPAGGAGGGGGGLFSWIGGLFGSSKAPDLSKYVGLTGLFADGTESAPGGMALVGERGRELVNLPRGAQVVPNHKTEGMISAANNNRGSNGRSPGGVLQVVIQGASGDDHVRKLVEQGVAAGLQAQQIEADRGGFASTQQNYLRRKG